MSTALTAPSTPDVVRREVQEDPERRQMLRDATGELLNATQAFLGRYVVLPDEAASIAASLYVLHTWTVDAADATPYLVIVSKEKGSGKTRMLETLTLLVRKPWHTASTTEAALFRKIEQDRPTLLLDEIDTVFNGSARSEPLRAVLNAGNRRGSTVTRCEGKGTREYSTFGAKVLAGIDTGGLPETVRDRSIVIEMRKRSEEPVERMRPRLAEQEAQPLLQTLQVWALVAVEQLAALEPALPSSVSDRAADAWEPLLAIAEFAGGKWAGGALEAAAQLSSSKPTPELEKSPHSPLDGLLPSMRAAMGGEPA
jgi:hypothetical protein